MSLIHSTYVSVLLFFILFMTGSSAQLYTITNYKNQCMSYYPSTGNIAGAGIIFIPCNSKDPTQAWQLVNIPNSAYLICANSNFCMSVNYGNLCSYAYLVKKNTSDKAPQWKTLSNGSVTNVFLASKGFNLCAQSVLGLYSGVIVSYINMIDCFTVPSQIFKTSPRLPVG